MKKTMIILAAGTFLLAGCRKDLCYNHDEHGFGVRVNVAASWEQEWERYSGGTDWETEWPGLFGLEYRDLIPQIPEGIRANVYTEEQRKVEANLQPEGGRLGMTAGKHSILFYNNDTEYITFQGTDSWATAAASTRTRTRTRSGGDMLEGKTPPDQLYAAYIDNYEATATDSASTLPVVMQPMVYTYLICFEFEHGANYVALARGALTGMASGVYLIDGRTSDEGETLLFEEECHIDKDFGVWAVVKSFGVPGLSGKSETPLTAGQHTLELEVRLGNGTMKVYEFDVSGQLALQPRGGILYVQGIAISDEEGMQGSGAFDVTVKDWGEYVDIVLPLD